MEEIYGERQSAWVREHTDRTVAEFTSGPEFADMKQKVLEATGKDDNKGARPERSGDWFFGFRYDAEHPKGVWRRTPFADYRRGAATWEELLDVSTLGEDENGAPAFPGSPGFRRGSGSFWTRFSSDSVCVSGLLPAFLGWQ